MTGVRSFVAVPIPAGVRARLLAAAGALARELPGVKGAAKIENFHVTIKFLGQLPEERLEELAGALARGLRAVPAFTVEARGLGAFPTPRHANVVWAAVDDRTGGLVRVAEIVDAAVAGLALAVAPEGREGVAAGGGVRVRKEARKRNTLLGNQNEARAFHPHVTVGRSKAGVDARARVADAADTFGEIPVDEVHLYESRLSRTGSTYVLRATAALARA
jgi:2'-5' RNA ligase